MSSPETRKVHPLLLLLSHTQRLMSMKYSNLKKKKKKNEPDDLPKAKSSSNISPNSCQHRNYILLTNCTCHYNHNDPDGHDAACSLLVPQAVHSLTESLGIEGMTCLKSLLLHACMIHNLRQCRRWLAEEGEIPTTLDLSNRTGGGGLMSFSSHFTLLNVPKLYWLCLFIHMEYLHTLCRMPI